MKEFWTTFKKHAQGAVDVLSQPTAPFREKWVVKAIEKWCKKEGIDYNTDAFGNVWVNTGALTNLPKLKLLFVAHLDHPGIVIHDLIAPNIMAGDWLGGMPKNLVGQRVKAFSTSTKLILDGEIFEHHEQAVKIRLDNSIALPAFSAALPWGACLWFEGLEGGYTKTDDTWVIRAADDLFLVWTLLEALKAVRPIRGEVGVLFTRSEEKGLIGSYFAATESPLTHKTKVISVDVTEVGEGRPEGVMVRWKDQDGQMDKKFAREIYERIKSRCRAFFQPGSSKGDTDSTAFSKLGFSTAGISITVGNYHNKVRGGVGPEFISEADRRDLLKALGVLMR